MVSFSSDYIAGAHPKILEMLAKTNMEQLSGYGTDPYCKSAAEKIKKAIDCPDAEVFFLVGGTQTNEVIISTMLMDCEGVVAADTGHVSLHEAGAIEYTGHKVLQVPGHNGLIHADELETYLTTFYKDENHEHMVQPGMVYISYSSEYGTLYKKSELAEIKRICEKYDLPLFIDGARLGYGLAGSKGDMTLPDLAKLCDVFYIGGTKVGALCGEAVVFTHKNAPKYFMTQVKQRGAMLAKGRLLGIQFDVLFTDDLYTKISDYAIEKAMEVKKLLNEKGYRFFLDSPTNQQFVVVENKKLEELSKHVVYGFWEAYDETHTVIRFATSWSTTEEDICELKKWI